jgi:hypothetical protein
MFASFKQIEQAADMFLGAWAVKNMMHPNKKDRKHPNLDKIRKLDPTFEVSLQMPIHH